MQQREKAKESEGEKTKKKKEAGKVCRLIIYPNKIQFSQWCRKGK